MMPWLEAFHRPTTIAKALRLMKRGDRRARFVAGATDLLVEADPAARILVDVGRLGLAYIKPHRGGWRIGAATTMAMLEQSEGIRAFAGGILARAAAASGSIQIRNRATAGGNLANASPAADLAPPLLVLDAQVVIAGQKGKRRLPLADFFKGVRQTALHGDLLVEIILAPLNRAAGRRGGERSAWSFQKLGRVESDIAIVNAAAGVGVDTGGRCRWARIAVGAVAPTPLRIPAAESALQGRPLDGESIALVCEMVCRESRPISDLRASADYRRQMSGVLVRRALEECLANIEPPRH
jgi:carbon-monoxide dehydrogenase medium subunit